MRMRSASMALNYVLGLYVTQNIQLVDFNSKSQNMSGSNAVGKEPCHESFLNVFLV